MLRNSSDERLEHLRRFTRTIPGAAEVLQFFQLKGVIDRMTVAARDGIPPVTAVSADLVELLGHHRAKNPQLAKFVGRATRVLMEEHDFELSKRNVRVRADPMFSVASAYRHAPPAKPRAGTASTNNDLLFRILGTLNLAELKAVQNHVRAMLKNR